jgi:hypothetical protein
MYNDRLGNIKWAHMFLRQARSLRNIMTYIHQPNQKAKKHKVDPYVSTVA